MTVDILLLIVGAGLMLGGGVMLARCTGGQSQFLELARRDRTGAAQSDYIYMGLVFLSVVIAPLLGGAILIVAGLT